MNILVIASHPDDEVLGCGGTISKHIQDGDKVHILFLSQGRVESCQIDNSCGVLGVQYTIGDLKAQHFETKPQSEIADMITYVLKNDSYDVVYTHTPNDLNKDHKVAYEATMVATRPNLAYAPKAVYGYEVMGSNLQPNPFNPTYYVDISSYTDNKVKAMECYVEEMNKYPQPRSIGGILIYAEFRGLECGIKYAEAFETYRVIV